MTSHIQAAIQQYGARAVYAAANARMSGDRSKLAALSLVADDLAQANAIQMEAFRQLGEADKVIDLADATARLA